MLYTEPIIARLGTKRRRFGYADDIAIVTFGRTLTQTAAAATEQLQELLRWGAENAIDFDPAKTEVMHFPGKEIRIIQQSYMVIIGNLRRNRYGGWGPILTGS